MTSLQFPVLHAPALAFLALAAVAAPVTTRAQLVDRPVFVEARVPKPPTVASARSGDYLIYEIHATNLEAKPLTWTSVEVLDAKSGATLLTVRDSALAADLARPGAGALPAATRATIAAGMRGVLYLEVPVTKGTVPTAVRHRLTFTDSAGSRTLTTKDIPVTSEIAVIGPPLRGGAWFAANGPGNASGHRRTVIALNGTTGIAQRFAIDYVMVDSQFKTHRGDSLDNSKYYAHGVDVLAVDEGTVVAVKDGLKENVPGINSRAVPITLETVGGNHIILDIGKGRYAFYAHVQPGSLRVKLGDHVKRGDVLARLGNTGNSTEPHLHFHLADANSPLGSEGIPYVHEMLEFDGECAGFGEKCEWTKPTVVRRVMPFDSEIVRFPK